MSKQARGCKERGRGKFLPLLRDGGSKSKLEIYRDQGTPWIGTLRVSRCKYHRNTWSFRMHQEFLKDMCVCYMNVVGQMIEFAKHAYVMT